MTADVERPVICAKCGATSGNDWKQCEGSCPLPDSPHYKKDAGIEPMPLPEWVKSRMLADAMHDYARANVEHHTAAQAAEIEALRAEVEALKSASEATNTACIRWADDAVAQEDRAMSAEAHAERLAEALLCVLPFAEHSDSCGDRDAYNLAVVRTCDCGLDGIREHADELLHPTAAQPGGSEQWEGKP